MNTAWKDGEIGYCLGLVIDKGDPNVGHDRFIIISYLRAQASSAFHYGEYEISARLGEAATALSSGTMSYAWKRAIKALDHTDTYC